MHHHLHSLDRVLSGSRLAGQHDRIGGLHDGRRYIRHLRPGRTRIADHRIQHLRCHDDRLVGSVHLFDDHLLDMRNLPCRNLDAHITASNHHTVCFLNDPIDVPDPLLTLHLRDDMNILRVMLPEQIPDFPDVIRASDK